MNATAPLQAWDRVSGEDGFGQSIIAATRPEPSLRNTGDVEQILFVYILEICNDPRAAAKGEDVLKMIREHASKLSEIFLGKAKGYIIDPLWNSEEGGIAPFVKGQSPDVTAADPKGILTDSLFAVAVRFLAHGGLDREQRWHQQEFLVKEWAAMLCGIPRAVFAEANL